MVVRKLLLLLYCITTGCGVNCIESGSGISSSSIEIKVSPKVKKCSSTSCYWVDSGESILENQTLKMTVDGTINLCPKDSSNPKNIIVPAVFCDDGTVPEYSDDNDETDPKIICRNHGGRFSREGRYIDTGISVNQGDILSFDLIPKKIIINDCRKLPPGVVIDGPNIYYSDRDGKKSISSIDVCRSGGSFYMKGDDGNIYEARDEKGNSVGPIKFEPLQGREFEVLVGDGFTPYDNKVYHERSSKELLWKSGALLDLRNAKPQLEESLKDCSQPLNQTTKKFSSYDINCFCNKICYNSKGVWWNSMNPDQSCTSSIRYKFKNNNDKCSLKLEDFDLDKETGFRTSWAELLVAKISSDNKLDWNSIGNQCIPERGANQKCISFDNDFEKVSVKLNYNYRVNCDGHVMLGISDGQNNYYDNAGGYYVKVQRTCPLSDGKKLYMYIDDTPPTMLPGEDGTFPICKSNDKNCSGIYEINKDNHPKAGKIYFGINTKDIQDEQFTDISQEFINANKYTINIFRTRWDPIFSNFFISIRDIVLSVLYGTSISTGDGDISSAINSPKGGAIRQIYNNYSTSKPFWNGVRVLFVLYIMFSAIGYILGLIQVSKFDLSIRMLKIAFIVMIFSQDSWKFFSTHFFALFIQGVSQLITDFSGYLEADNSFRFLDPTVGILLAGDTWLRFLSLFFAGPIGWLVFLMIMWGSFSFFACILEAIIMYFMMIISVSFLLSLSPLFFTFILFQRTKQLFDGWIKLLLNFSIQPIILFSALAFLNQALISTLYTITNFTACPRCIGEFKIYENEEGGICLFEVLLPGGFSNNLSFTERARENERGNSLDFFGLPFSITSILLYLIIANAMRGFARIAELIALSISGALSNMIGHRGAAIDNASQALLSLVGLDRDTRSIINTVRKQSITNRRPIRFEDSNAVGDLTYRGKGFDKSSELREDSNHEDKKTIGEDQNNKAVNRNLSLVDSSTNDKRDQSGNKSDESDEMSNGQESNK